ncbi:MAG: L-2-amino-thiazoline-4-carboxylic acid hydrolase [Gemmatimonadota bacterium]
MSESGKRVAEATRQRAAVYAHLFAVLREKLGEDRAVALMSEAIRAHGQRKASQGYSAAARSGDLRQAAREFASPDEVKQFQFAPRVESASEEQAVIAMSRCPLVDQWTEMGLPAADVATLCRIARAVDFGTWEGALGFDLAFEGTRGDGKRECVLRVRKRQAKE